ncbi:MAG: hypothetical protein M1838_000484 [Thelocarpon superellum]|nr:MAG: hypothetical protein M1838_000484 [Thelocarpon superellum]
MTHPILVTSLQAGVMSGLSSVLAQVIDAYRRGVPLEIDLLPVVHFALFSLLVVPPNYLWQRYLEDTFPAHPERRPVEGGRKERGDQASAAPRSPSLHLGNTFTKLALDQALGASLNTLLFLAAMGAFRGGGASEITRLVQRDFWPVMISGLKLWPLVSLLLFTVVPFEQRMLVGGSVNFAWSIYLSSVAAQ